MAKIVKPKLFLREIKGVAEQENVRALEVFFATLVEEINRRDDVISELRRTVESLREADAT